MTNSIFSIIGNNMPIGNMGIALQQFEQFKRTFYGDPKARVQQLLNSGAMTQAQFNQLSQMANQFQRMIR